MITLKSFKAYILTALIAVGMIMSSCTSTGTDTDEASKEAEKVRVMELKSISLANTIELTASLIAYEEVYLAPATPGRIERIEVEVGSRFSKGDLLVVMDQTQLHQARIQYNTLKIDMARFDTLVVTGSIPRQQYDQLKAQYDMAKNNLQFLEDNSKLRAPFSGIVSGKYYQNGEMFSGAPNTQVGKAAVISLVQINPLKAMVNVSERYFPLIKAGMDVEMFNDIYPDDTISAKVLRVYPTIDPLSRSFQVELTVPNSSELLRPGMFCRASFVSGDIEAILVPSLSVLKLQGSNERYVFIEKDGKAVRTVVSLGRRHDDMVEIYTNGVKSGDRIIVSGQSRLVDGDKVSVVE